MLCTSALSEYLCVKNKIMEERDEARDDFSQASLEMWRSTPAIASYARDVICSVYKTRPGAFPGPNPISMDVEHLEIVKSKPYVCALKVDGMRFHALFFTERGQPQLALVDRRWCTYTASYVRGPASCFHRYMVDAELVGNTLFIFDVLMIDGVSLVKRSYTDRLDAGKQHWLCDVRFAFGQRLINIKMKDIFDISEAFDKIKHTTEPEYQGPPVDGLVFTPVKTPVQTFTHWFMFKYKRHHTIDLRLRLCPEGGVNGAPEEVHTPISEVLRHSSMGPKTSTALKTTPDCAIRQKPSLLNVLKRGKRSVPSDRKRKRGETSSEEPKDKSSPRSQQWNVQLKYALRDGTEQDATRIFLFADRELVFRIYQDKTLNNLLTSIKNIWNETSSKATKIRKETLLAVDLIVECEVKFQDDSNIVWVKILRPRPDKDRPNTHLTITNTLLSISNGVQMKHLERLATV